MPAEQLITQHLHLWTSAIKRKSSAGRGSSRKVDLYGIKRLRELILELAVRGLLVPQDPKDEPASELLKRIGAEKAKLVKAGEIKATKSLPLIAEDEAPFAIPNGWALARLGDVINVLNGRAYKKHEMLLEGTPILRVGNLFTSNEWYFSDLQLEPEKYITDGDLIYAWSASFGPFIWQGGKVIYHYHIWKMDFFSKPDVDKYYFRNYLQAVSAAIKESGNGIAMIHMTKERMERLVLPIPPLPEQHRIVAKVDELMALCDQLEQQTDASLSAHQTLVETLLNALTSAADHAQFVSSWQRIAEHFDTLFTTEESIDQLKQAILLLAVMGKLVPQDPEDESASELLKKVAAKPSRHALRGWATVPLGQLGDVLGGATPSKSNSEYWTGEIPWVSPKDMKRDVITDAEDHVSEEAIANSSLRKVPSGSLLMVVRGMILAHSFPVAISERVVTINQDMKALVIPQEIGPYLLLFLQAMKQAIVELVDRSSHGTCKLVSEKLWAFPVSVPPYTEQRRILAKVGELTALCGQLKFHLIEANSTQLHLADTLAEKALARA